MIKIPTMFVRDESKRGRPVLDQVKPECQWVLDGEGVATEKRDGTNVKIENGQLFKRQKPKERDYDMASYVPCDRANPSDKWAWEGFDALGHAGGGMHSDVPPEDGIYELVGPEIQCNPDGFEEHTLIRVVPPVDTLTAKGPMGRTFDGLLVYLTVHPIEGLVFHHPDGRMAKIKRRDFGLPWPVK